MADQVNGPPDVAPTIVTRPELGLSGKFQLASLAGFHLAMARLRLSAFRTSDVQLRNRIAEDHVLGNGFAGPARHELVAQIAWTVPRVARFLPFRADCLVQAMAAQDWLRENGVSARLTVGIRQGDDYPLESHAWLSIGGEVIVGGEIADFAEVLG